MTVTYKGLDCLKDMSTMEYMALKKKSQAKIPWAAQTHYGKVTVYFGVATIFVALLKHFWYKYKDRRYRVSRNSPSGFISSLVYVITGYCRCLGYQPTPELLVSAFSFPFTIGNTLYAVFASGFLFCYCLVPHFWYRGCRGFGSPPLAVRAGIMSTALTPFIFVLAGKRNVISSLTGIGYEKLNWLHQFVAVASLVLAVIHTIPFIHQALAEGGPSNLATAFEDFTYRNGIPPLVLLILLCSMFRKEIRKMLYELSFHFHWAMGCGYFGTLMYHVYDMLDMQDYLWGTLAFWMAQTIYRMCTSGLTRSRAAEIQRLDDKTFEVTVYDTKGLKWRPGQHCFLRFPQVQALDNHPFSISSVSEEEHLKFIIVPKKGLTKKLHDSLMTETVRKKVLVDGPYGGSSRDITGFDKIIMFATGSGVTVTLPYLTALAHDTEGTQVAHFVWVVRNSDNIEWIRKEIDKITELAEGRISIDIYCVEPVDEKFSSKNQNMRVHSGKPDMRQIAFAFKHGLLRRNLIISSGSESMRRVVNEAAADFQKVIFNSTTSSLYVEEVCLHTEAFGW